MVSALHYEEPGIVSILVVSSFLLLLNVADCILNALVSCGLIAQLFLGVFWGTPLGGWLGSSLEAAITQLGYLGLILMVYEGGLNTALRPLVSNLPLSAFVALTGILAPIALSFAVLPSILNASPLQCFAAGAALSATSLGTTFAILSTSGFVHTRLGTILTSAAMLDDVIGLVMIQVVSSLGSGSTSGGAGISGEAVGRPVGASVGLLGFVGAACWVWGKLCRHRKFPAVFARRETRWGAHTGLLLALVVIASYAGASALFAAFMAGVAGSWWDDSRTRSPSQRENSGATAHEEERGERWTGPRLYEHYYAAVVQRVLTPFFFASIGFSIPITQMFRASTVWKGIVYAVLMALGKLLCGAWLVRFSLLQVGGIRNITSEIRVARKLGWGFFRKPERPIEARAPQEEATPAPKCSEKPEESPTTSDPPLASPPREGPSPSQQQPQQPSTSATPSTAQQPPPKPRSLYPPLILGLAMVARGEVAFLIASVAESQGIFGSEDGGDGGGEIFLVVVWAAVVCTVLGPLGVGSLVRRVRALEKKRGEAGAGGAAHESVLGVWGVG